MSESEKDGAGTPANTDRVPENTPGAGENICRRCEGVGELDDEPCPECDGSGTVWTPVGGAG
nr:hypothetical protein [uncultured organism]